MALPSPVARQRAGALLLADITGYTGFLSSVAEAHRAIIVDTETPPPAYAVVSHLLDTIVTAIGPDFRLAKVEGDAVFAVADGGVARGTAFVEAVEGWYGAFRNGLQSAQDAWTCSCDACIRIGQLDVKFIVHHGTWIAQVIVGQEELLGPDVNVAHRLLKNHARDRIGPRPYALFSLAAVEALAIPTDGLVPSIERYDGPLVVESRVLPLG